MEYGLIGEKLTHSFSKEIHAKIGNYPYELLEIPREKLSEFLALKNFRAVNVTIPYKEAVIPFLNDISAEAKKIGAVNLIVNKNGALYGYNTDYYGAKRMIERADIQVKGKKALILGSGGTKKTLYAVLSDLGAKEILIVSRKKSDDAITYEEATYLHNDAEIIANATPVGMFPSIDDMPIDPDCFKNLSGVIDVIYNPLTTRLIESVQARGIPRTNGLYMLAAQAVRAYSLVKDIPTDESLCESVYVKTLREKRNVVLIGMPSSGKTEIGKRIAEKTGRIFIDTDFLTQRRTGKCPAAFIKEYGEAAFRAEEAISVKEAAAKTGCVIATGGGIINVSENIRFLKKNGKIFFLDRPLSLLSADENHPLSETRAALERLYEKRLPLYLSATDERIKNDSDEESAAEQILRGL